MATIVKVWNGSAWTAVTGGVIPGAATIIDDWTGTNGAAWNPAIWQAPGAGTATIQSNQGAMVSAGAYQQSYVSALDIVDADGNYRVDITIDGDPGDVYTRFRNDSAFGDGWRVRIMPTAVDLEKVTGYTPTTVDTASFTMNDTDVIHERIVLSGSNIDIYLWRNAESEPGTPTLSVVDSAWSTQTRWEFRNWSMGAACTFRYDNWTVE